MGYRPSRQYLLAIGRVSTWTAYDSLNEVDITAPKPPGSNNPWGSFGEDPWGSSEEDPWGSSGEDPWGSSGEDPWGSTIHSGNGNGTGGFGSYFIPISTPQPPKSDLLSASAFAGYSGLIVDKNAALLRYTAQEATSLADIANSLKAVKVFVTASKSLGLVGAGLTGIESYNDGDGFSWGDGVKVGIGIVTTFTPYGWAYAVVDISTGIITGTTLTDHIGNAIDGE